MPKLVEHALFKHETILSVRAGPRLDMSHCLTLHARTCLLSLCPNPASSSTARTGWRAFTVLSAPSDDRLSLLSCSLSGRRLPPDALHGPVAVMAAAAAPREPRASRAR